MDEAARLLAAAGLESPRAEARSLLAHALGVTRDDTLSGTTPLSPEQAAAFAAMVARRVAREPSAYITGHKEFWSLDFMVGPGVLVPRPETETLIDEALRLVPDSTPPLKIADLGTGSGALLIAALSEFPKATGIGFESSDEAFAWARKNTVNMMPERAQIRLADWKEAEGPFDMVFANPPYIPSADIEGLDPEVSRFEPRAALDGGRDGLAAYRGLAKLLPLIVKPGGHALLEIGFGQGPAMELVFEGMKIIRITQDLAGIERVLVLENHGQRPLKSHSDSLT
jgi:release factor glutamine methyltransferase